MKTIHFTLVDNVITPSELLPANALLIVFNGTEYVVYEDGDELPSEPLNE